MSEETTKEEVPQETAQKVCVTTRTQNSVQQSSTCVHNRLTQVEHS